MEREELDKILEKHKKWLKNKNEGERADLRGADLRGANLRGVDLHGAYLQNANLFEANLRGANLQWTDLFKANLYGANLDEACLNEANLRCAYLQETEFCRANLRDANLSEANLCGAYLCGADLRGANFSGADLSEANFCGADIFGARFDDSETIRFGKILSEDWVGYKKCRRGVIVELIIPKGSVVFSINNDKCRTNRAIVKRIIGGVRGYSMHKFFSYYEKDEIMIKDFSLQYNEECAQGIHFFRTLKEAEEY